MITVNELRAECERILSRDGKVTFNELNPIAKAKWNAYSKGFMEAYEFLIKPKIETHKVCEQCEALGIIDVNCICVTENRYPTIEKEISFCKICNHETNI